METKKYTCIKPTTHRHEKISVGDEMELTPEQARPLQHGGFITFDEEAAKCVRLLAKGEEETAVDSETRTATDEGNVGESDRSPSTDTQRSSTAFVSYEKGD